MKIELDSEDLRGLFEALQFVKDRRQEYIAAYTSPAYNLNRDSNRLFKLKADAAYAERSINNVIKLTKSDQLNIDFSEDRNTFENDLNLKKSKFNDNEEC